MDSTLALETRKIYTVSEVTRDIKVLLEDSFPALWLEGEISNYHRSAAGHIYFTLKDERAQIAAVMFRGSNHRLRFEPEDGLHVIVHGQISVYEARGQYQILLDHIEPKGVGALQLALEQLKKRLEEEGLFDEAHKKEIPTLPRKVGVVTSPQGAVLHDILTIIKRRFPNMDVCVMPVRVQGEGSADEIAQAISAMNRRGDVDVLIVGRGGGSLEDLWSFNEEVVVRAIFASQIPVISAVGHETDFTLADLVADLRAPTPSAAAELAVPEKADLAATIESHRSGLLFALRENFKRLREQIRSLRKGLKDPRRFYREALQRIDDLEGRLLRAEKNLLERFRHRLKQAVGKLTVLSPKALLERGFAIAFPEGKETPIRSVRDVKSNDRIEIQLADGRLKAIVAGRGS